MTAGRCALLSMLLAGGDCGARSEPPLPVWNDGDLELLESGAFVPGSVLLGTGTVDPETGRSDEVAAVPAPEPGDEPVEPAPPVAEIPEEFLAAYFGERPEDLLVDPQQLLSRQEFVDQLAFQRYHAGDSAVDLFIYVFDSEQEIPGEARAEELVERFFGSGRPAAVVFYHLGAPKRSRVLLSPQLAEVVSTAEQRRTLQSSVTKALEKSNPVDQLEGFSVQLSIRLYWMEKAFSGTPMPAEPMVVLAEKPVPEPEANRLAEWLRVVRPWAIGVGGGLSVLVLGVLGWWLVVRRMSYRFPEFDVAPRLGGAHGAGVGAVVTFGNPGLPPSYQREQVPDYLRRM